MLIHAISRPLTSPTFIKKPSPPDASAQQSPRVKTEDFSDSALVLVGHGSTLNQQSSHPVRQLAEQLATRNLFAQVTTAFNLEEPKIQDVPNINARRIFVVPITVSKGLFTEETIPFQLGLCKKGQCDCPEGECNYPRAEQRAGKQLIYTHPVGTHPSMTYVLLSQASSIVEQHPFPHAPQPDETALFIAGHGTGQNRNSRKSVEAQVEAIRACADYIDVLPAFMEEPPSIADCYTATDAQYIVMVPFFIADGLHTVEDIPILLGEPEDRVKEHLAENRPTWRNPTKRKGKLLWYTPAIGTAPHLPEVILERVREQI